MKAQGLSFLTNGLEAAPLARARCSTRAQQGGHALNLSGADELSPPELPPCPPLHAACTNPRPRHHLVVHDAVSSVASAVDTARAITRHLAPAHSCLHAVLRGRALARRCMSVGTSRTCTEIPHPHVHCLASTLLLPSPGQAPTPGFPSYTVWHHRHCRLQRLRPHA
jgi:hypothetical protein